VQLPQCFVYIINSQTNPTRYYTGRTSDIALRLADHNGGRCRRTATGRPWKFVVVVEFANERRAIEFEKYLKSGSGCAFSVRHFR
jgi:putative endonuclease